MRPSTPLQIQKTPGTMNKPPLKRGGGPSSSCTPISIENNELPVFEGDEKPDATLILASGADAARSLPAALPPPF
jgi:hypothetical protein